MKIVGFFTRILKVFPGINICYNLLVRSNIRSIIKLSNLFTNPDSSLHKLFSKYSGSEESNSLDLGCGMIPKNPFKASILKGIDLIEDFDNNISKCRLGFEKIPFDDNFFSYVTAFDLIEHIPRYSDDPSINHAPFIFLMNDIWRVLKKDGIFLSYTPVYPFLGAFQDPTHNNIITVDTFEKYFSKNKYDSAKHYGILCNFQILEQHLFGEHLVTIMKK